jgi:hypothetical protein
MSRRRAPAGLLDLSQPLLVRIAALLDDPASTRDFCMKTCKVLYDAYRSDVDTCLFVPTCYRSLAYDAGRNWAIPPEPIVADEISLHLRIVDTDPREYLLYLYALAETATRRARRLTLAVEWQSLPGTAEALFGGLCRANTATLEEAAFAWSRLPEDGAQSDDGARAVVMIDLGDLSYLKALRVLEMKQLVDDGGNDADSIDHGFTVSRLPPALDTLVVRDCLLGAPTMGSLEAPKLTDLRLHVHGVGGAGRPTTLSYFADRALEGVRRMDVFVDIDDAAAISGSIAPILEGLPRLESLWLDGLHSCARLPDAFLARVPPRLTHLSLAPCISLEDFGVLHRLPATLESLRLEDVTMDGCLAGLTGLRGLTRLELRNHFGDLAEDTFLNFPNLRSLFITGKEPIARVPESLGSLPRLTVAFLHVKVVPPGITRLTALERLVLVGCTADALPDDFFGELKNLTFLRLDRCGLRSLPPSVGALVGLDCLEVTRCHGLSVIPPLGHLRALTWLHLCELPLITDIGFADGTSADVEDLTRHAYTYT